jgi:hypothetical protein
LLRSPFEGVAGNASTLEPRQLLLLLVLQGRIANLPGLLQGLLLLAVLPLPRTQLLVVLVLRLLSLEVLAVFVVLDLALALLLEALFLLLALAFELGDLLLPCLPLRCDLSVEPILLARIVLDEPRSRPHGDQPFETGHFRSRR